eukprot:TRINITY_DN8140_c0_g1_i1.p1 TRINITY_DN8140_c0_g1~~TRINITY_DN8140_c0_g1_i1.p1  ORF type:complete len:368 (+),score=52.43 TRINITY_DN8140_c0_g1_i1:110-1213(+)
MTDNLIFVGTAGHVIALDSSVQPPKTIWKTKLPGVGGHPINVVYCPSGAIYCGAYDRTFKLNAADGAVVWKADTERICSVWLHDKSVLVGHNGYLTRLGAADGKRLWQSNLKGAGWATVSVCVLGETVYAACKGELYAFKLEDGEQVWHDNLKGRGYGYITLLPASSPIAKHQLVVGLNGTVTIFDLSTREEICHADVSGFHKCPIALVPFQDDYWVASSDGVHRLGGEKLDTKFHNDLKGTGNALAYSLVYSSSANMMVEGHSGHLTGFNPADGKTAWSLKINDHSRFLTTLEWKENAVLVGAYGGLFAVDAKTGSQIWSLSASDLDVGSCTMGLCTPNNNASVHTNQPYTGEHELALAKRMVALT